jgi:hypothetical protein
MCTNSTVAHSRRTDVLTYLFKLIRNLKSCNEYPAQQIQNRLGRTEERYNNVVCFVYALAK